MMQDSAKQQIIATNAGFGSVFGGILGLVNTVMIMSVFTLVSTN